MNILEFEVVNKIKETDDSFSFVLKPINNTRPGYKSGQYLPIKIHHKSGVLFRSYSLSSSPAANEDFKITVKRVQGGKGSNWLCDNINVGDSLETLYPAGNFYPQHWNTNTVLFAGGSGITPIISIIKTMLIKYNNKIKLFYASSLRRSVIFKKELKALALQYPERLKVEFWLSDEQGTPTPSEFERYIDSDPHIQYLMCGPTPFMDSAEKLLIDSGIASDLITKESFTGSASSECDTVESSAEKDVTVNFMLNGIKNSVMCSEDDFILNEIIKAGINVPSSCCAGNCGSCMCLLVSGDVILESNTVLDASDEEDGWILACRSKPKSKYIEISFDQ